MRDNLIYAYNDIQDTLNNLKSLGISDSRGVIQSLKDALSYLDDMIADTPMEGEE